jgi:hypothetical protein
LEGGSEEQGLVGAQDERDEGAKSRGDSVRNRVEGRMREG